MIVIIEFSSSGTERVLNVMPHDQPTIAEMWIANYLTEKMASMSYAPAEKNQKYVSYYVSSGVDTLDSTEPTGSAMYNQMSLIKRYKRIHPGYIYNTGEWTLETVLSVKYIMYSPQNDTAKTRDWQELNDEINKSVLCQLDRDNLYYVIGEIDDKLKLMCPQLSCHFTEALAQTLRASYKDIYKTTIRRMKRLRGKDE
jgi:hypothetical protein